MDGRRSDASAESELMGAVGAVLGRSGSRVVVDVGANVGDFAQAVLDMGGSLVYCLEPASEPFQHLRDRFAGCDQAVVRKLGVAESDGETTMYVTESSLGSSFLMPKPGQQSQWTKVKGSEVVEAVRLSTFLNNEGIERVGLLKIDTQGTDLKVLRSLGESLSPQVIQAILIEVNFHEFYVGQDAFPDIYSLLYQRGYFLADLFRHYNRKGWLWWGDALFLPSTSAYSTQLGEENQ